VIWIVKGPAQLRRVKISGVTRNRPQLTFDVHTGYRVACVRQYTVEPPSGLTLPARSLGRHVSMRADAPQPRRLRFRATLRNGALQIDTLGTASCSVQFTISGLHATPELRQLVRRDKHRAPLRRVTVVAANGHSKPRRLVKYASVG
jgi:hypothetical protein